VEVAIEVALKTSDSVVWAVRTCFCVLESCTESFRCFCKLCWYLLLCTGLWCELVMLLMIMEIHNFKVTRRYIYSQVWRLSKCDYLRILFMQSLLSNDL
jgi:hypothetical protein